MHRSILAADWWPSSILVERVDDGWYLYGGVLQAFPKQETCPHTYTLHTCARAWKFTYIHCIFAGIYMCAVCTGLLQTGLQSCIYFWSVMWLFSKCTGIDIHSRRRIHMFTDLCPVICLLSTRKCFSTMFPRIWEFFSVYPRVYVCVMVQVGSGRAGGAHEIPECWAAVRARETLL